MPLSKETRQKLIDTLAASARDSMFGDGLEEDYIMDGLNFKGLNHMDDHELIDEFRMVFGGEDDELIYDEDQELLEQAIAEAGEKPETPKYEAIMKNFGSPLWFVFQGEHAVLRVQAVNDVEKAEAIARKTAAALNAWEKKDDG